MPDRQGCTACAEESQWLSYFRATPQPTPPAARTHFILQTRHGMICIALSDIFYFHAEHKHVTAVHRDGQTLVGESLKLLENEFPDVFLRIHRSFLINRMLARRLLCTGTNQYQLYLKHSSHPLPVSRRQVKALQEAMHKL